MEATHTLENSELYRACFESEHYKREKDGSVLYCDTIDLGNGLQADMKVVNSNEYLEDDGWKQETPWCEVVVFEDGHEIGCSEVSDYLEGEWYIDLPEDTLKLTISH
jgi:hypothetical protein